MEENGVSKINGDDDDDVVKAKMEDIWEMKKNGDRRWEV